MGTHKCKVASPISQGHYVLRCSALKAMLFLPVNPVSTIDNVIPAYTRYSPMVICRMKNCTSKNQHLPHDSGCSKPQQLVL